MTSFASDQQLASHSETSSHAERVLMYLNQTSSGSYSDMLSVNVMLPHNYSESVGGRNDKFIAATAEKVNMQTVGGQFSSVTRFPVGNSTAVDPRIISRELLDNEQNILSHALSLSLGSRMPSFPLHNSYPDLSTLLSPSHLISNKGGISQKYEDTPLNKDLSSTECMPFGVSCSSQAWCNPNSLVRASETLTDPFMHGSQGSAKAVLDSKYLRPVQELLDEMASVEKVLKRSRSEKFKISHEIGLDGSKDLDERSNSRSLQTSSDSGIPTISSSLSELSPAERQDLLDKKAKLMSMLYEVDKKYGQYCHQLQILVSSFEVVAGSGAAESYTALALRTISRHFRCLRDAISGQIQLIQTKLGEQEGIPRLRYVDQQLRQQRSLQQLGVMRQAWRPQRGLPESSVSILRAWLFEHFLHPYPKDSEKITLARLTGLSRNQVANWFINARVRLWKPMIEEMYKEEFGESEMLSNISQEIAAMKDSGDNVQAPKDGEKEHKNITPGSSANVHLSQSNHTPSLQMDEGASRAGFLTSTRGDGAGGSRISKSPVNHRSNGDENNVYWVEIMPSNQIDGGSIMGTAGPQYDLSALGDLAVNGQVSLALELRNSESGGFPGSDGVKRSVNETSSSVTGETDPLDYRFMDPGKEQQRLVNPHLLHEFVV